MTMSSSETSSVHPGICPRRRSNRNNELPLTVSEWLDKKRREDGAEGLWRVHNKLYDLKDWMEKHPGGKHFIVSTQGTDITEAFECHHISNAAEKIIEKFYVREAKSPRNYLVTFHENGFYRTLKRKIRERNLFKSEDTKPQAKTKLLADVLAVSVFATALLGTVRIPSLLYLSGLLLSLLSVCAHNFFHMGDNWRMYYFQLSLMSLREWRISHVLSHHVYPNTKFDLEVTMLAPFWKFLPSPDKKLRYLSWLIGPFLLISLVYVQFARRFIKSYFSKEFNLEELVGFSIPLFLIIFSDQPIWTCLTSWNIILAMGSFSFGLIGFTAAHHHPDIYHEGDFLGENIDFGILQLAAVRGRIEVDRNFFLTLTTFGKHSLHHLFPTVDHEKLSVMDDVFAETCRQFKIDFTSMKTKSLVTGMFQQLVRNYTNSKLMIMR